MTIYVPVVDLSEHQGDTDFAKMLAAGVRGLILRVSHGTTIDVRYAAYYHQALEVGYLPTDIAHYTFCNPKRGSGTECAQATLDAIAAVVGHTRVGYMADVESHRNETPNKGTFIAGPEYAAWLTEHLATVRAAGVVDFGYSNRAYWNGAEGPNDAMLAADLDWLVARYPAYSDAAYARLGYPGPPDTWHDWAFRAQPPLPPAGGAWEGWQFAGGWDRQGPIYGASSRDLDLNIVHPDAWARWTNPQPEADMNYYVVTGANARFIGTPARVAWTGPGSAKVDAAIATQLAAGNLVQVDLTGGPNAFAATFLDGPLPTGDSLYTWTGDEFAAQIAGTVDTGARDAVGKLGDRVTGLSDAIARVGQVVGDTRAGLVRAGGGA